MNSAPEAPATDTSAFDAQFTGPEINRRWNALMDHLKVSLGKPKFTTESLLLLIGLQETGLLPRKFEKEEKLNLIHVGTCAVLTLAGYYRFSHRDTDNWPHYEPVKAIPFLDLFSQIHFLRYHILLYLEQATGLTAADTQPAVQVA